METLTKEEFWDPLAEKYPDLMTEFRAWIDKYKERVDWSNIFFSFVKYHDLPVAVQIGIFFQFMAETSWKHRAWNGEQFTVEEAVQGITDYFEEETAFRSDPPKRFHVCGNTCHPDQTTCNNYCNQKTVNGEKFTGPMPDSPAEIPFNRTTGRYEVEGGYQNLTPKQ